MPSLCRRRSLKCLKIIFRLIENFRIRPERALRSRMFLTVPISVSGVTVFPFAYSCLYILPFLFTLNLHREWKGHLRPMHLLREVLRIPYILLRRIYLRHASTVWITSTAGMPSFGCLSTGIPLPSSSTVMELSLCIVTLIVLQNPARASSILLSTTSYTRW